MDKLTIDAKTLQFYPIQNVNLKNKFYASVLEKPIVGTELIKAPLKIKSHRGDSKDEGKKVRLKKGSIKKSCDLKNIGILKQFKKFQDQQRLGIVSSTSTVELKKTKASFSMSQIKFLNNFGTQRANTSRNT